VALGDVWVSDGTRVAPDLQSEAEEKVQIGRYQKIQYQNQKIQY
jgi:hypothetical protein